MGDPTHEETNHPTEAEDVLFQHLSIRKDPESKDDIYIADGESLKGQIISNSRLVAELRGKPTTVIINKRTYIVDKDLGVISPDGPLHESVLEAIAEVKKDREDEDYLAIEKAAIRDYRERHKTKGRWDWLKNAGR